MITYMGKYRNGSNIYLCGLSTDTKPTTTFNVGGVDVKITNASVYECIDTGDVYKFDEAGSTWNNVGSYGGGGGSSLPGNYDYLTE